ncbi:MAG: hypothetical protein WC681_13630 [Sterolibacterium sp.]|jgi:hypothetical protein
MPSKYRMPATGTDTRKKSKRAPSRAAINTALDHWRRSFSGLTRPRPPDKKQSAEPGANRTADEANQENEHNENSTIASRVKAFIVGLALWGIIPPGLADWLIRRLRLGAM